MNSWVFYCALSGFFNGVVSTVMGFYVLSRNPGNIKNITYFLFCAACSIWSYSYLFWQNAATYGQALFYSRCLMFGAIFIPVFFLHHVFAILNIEKNNVFVLRLCYGFSLLSAAFAFHPNFVKSVTLKMAFRFWPEPGVLFHPFLAIWFMMAIYTMWQIYRGFRRSSGMLQNQMKYLFIASVIGWCGGGTNFFLWYDIPIPPLGNIAVSAYVALFAYVIVRFRLMEVRLAMTLTTIFFVVYGMIIGVPVALAVKARPWLLMHLGTKWWILPLTIYSVLLAAAPFIYSLLQRKAEARLLKERRHYQHTLLQASRGMTLIKDLNHLQNLIVHILTRTIRINHASIYLFNKETLQYECRVRRAFSPLKSAKNYSHDSLLVQYLARTRMPLVVEEVLYRELKGEGPDFKRLRHILRNLDADVIIPSFVHDNLLGFLMLGQKKSQEVFTPDDLNVLATLANQVALAIENCHFITELEMTQAQLFQASKMADLGTMASGIGHQINNRLNAIMLATEHGLLKDLAWIRTCIRDGKFNDLSTHVNSLDQTLKKVIENTKRGGEILNRLIDFTRFQDKTGPVNIHEAVEHSLCLWGYKRNLELVDFRDMVPLSLPPVDGIFSQIEGIIYNLLDNAYDAVMQKEEAWDQGTLPAPEMRSRGIVSIRAESLTRDSKPFVEIRVSDTGIGMTGETIQKIFIPFFTSKPTSLKGSGLGLYVIKKMVEAHQGIIDVDSHYGEGTTFRVLFPVSVEMEKPAAV